MAAHASIGAWRIPWTEEPGGPWGCKESNVTEHLSMHAGAGQGAGAHDCFEEQSRLPRGV